MAGRALAQLGRQPALHLLQLRRFQPVDLGHDDLVREARFVHQVHQGIVGVLGADLGIDQQQDAPQIGPAADVGIDQAGPALDLGFGDLCIAVARQVHQHQVRAEIEEIDLLRPARRVGDARQMLPAGERVQEARLADIGAAGERHLRQSGRRQAIQRFSAGDEPAFLREQPGPVARLGGGFGQGFTPMRHMMRRCCAIESVLFHAQ